MRLHCRTRRFWACAGPFALLALAMLVAPPNATAQPPGSRNLKIQEPAPFRVYQRDRDGRADIPIVFEKAEGEKDVKVGKALLFSSVTVRGEPVPTEGTRFENGKLLNVPVGGPYGIKVQFDNTYEAQVDNVFVGDLWVLAGQSNMEGYGDLLDVAPPDPLVMALGMNGTWSRAGEPLHWLADSPDPVHSGNPDDRETRSAEQHKTRGKGAGLGLPFAAAMVQATGVPVGLIPCAHGGTSMAQWDPGKKGDEGKSLYGSMLRQVKLAGGKVKGVLWYQGESDANPDASKAFPKTFADFIAAVRADFGQPELPFYYAQIGRFVIGGDPARWNAVQDAQRRLVERVPNTGVVSVIDLELDDLIHVGTQGLKRVGVRLARVAQRELFGLVGATTPTLDRVNKGAGSTLVVKFKGVNIGPRGGGMGGMGGGMGAGAGGGFRQMAVRGPAGTTVVGLKPQRHIAGFSIRKEDGTEVPLIFDAAVGSARDTVILKLVGPAPEKTSLWYGYGFNPYANLTDASDMAVPVFGPIPLDDLK